MNNLFVKIKFLLPTLPKAEEIVANTLLNKPEVITYLTLSDFSKESGTSEASIIRFCKRLGYSGYTALKEEFIKSISTTEVIESEGIKITDNMEEILKKVYKSNIQTLQDTMILAGDEFDRALEALITSKSIVFLGTGDAFAACQTIFMKFVRLGINTSAHSDVMLQLATAGNLSKDDVVIAISYEGRSRSIVESMKIAKENGATTIAITNMNKSPLLNYTDISLYTSVNDITVGRDKVTRRIADQFILDALYLGYITKTNKNHVQQLNKIQNAIEQNKI